MVVILACLSLILTAGGGAMALYGADFIRSESGLALTQSGITMLSAGLLLAGLTTAIRELRRMRELMELEEVPAPAAPAIQPVPTMPPVVVPPAGHAARQDGAPAKPSAADLAREETPLAAPMEPRGSGEDSAGPTVAKAELLALQPVKEVKGPAPGKLPPPPPSLTSPSPRPAGSGIPAEAKAGLVGIAPGRPARTGTAENAGPDAKADDALADASSPVPGHSATPSAPAGDGADEAAERAGELSPKPADKLVEGGAAGVATAAHGEERKMLATYNSGGITYFMFSDGSIEADMTGGRFRFTSMDELRGYIETGKGGLRVGPPETVAAG